MPIYTVFSSFICSHTWWDYHCHVIFADTGIKPLARTPIEKPKPVHVQPQVEKATGGVYTRG